MALAPGLGSDDDRRASDRRRRRGHARRCCIGARRRVADRAGRPTRSGGRWPRAGSRYPTVPRWSSRPKRSGSAGSRRHELDPLACVERGPRGAPGRGAPGGARSRPRPAGRLRHGRRRRWAPFGAAAVAALASASRRVRREEPATRRARRGSRLRAAEGSVAGGGRGARAPPCGDDEARALPRPTRGRRGGRTRSGARLARRRARRRLRAHSRPDRIRRARTRAPRSSLPAREPSTARRSTERRRAPC